MLDKLLKASANAGIIRKDVAPAMNTKAPGSYQKSGGGRGGQAFLTVVIEGVSIGCLL